MRTAQAQRSLARNLLKDVCAWQHRPSGRAGEYREPHAQASRKRDAPPMKLRGAPALSQVRTASSSRLVKTKGAYLSRMAMDFVEMPVSGCTCTSTRVERTRLALVRVG